MHVGRTRSRSGSWVGRARSPASPRTTPCWSSTPTCSTSGSARAATRSGAPGEHRVLDQGRPRSDPRLAGGPRGLPARRRDRPRGERRAVHQGRDRVLLDAERARVGGRAPRDRRPGRLPPGPSARARRVQRLVPPDGDARTAGDARPRPGAGADPPGGVPAGLGPRVDRGVPRRARCWTRSRRSRRRPCSPRPPR